MTDALRDVPAAESCSLNLFFDINVVLLCVCVHNNPTVTTVCLQRSRQTIVVIQWFPGVSHSLPQSPRYFLNLRWDLQTTVFHLDGK